MKKTMENRGLRGGSRAGFTLIEVMIVIAIVLALMGLVGVALFGQRDQAKKQMAEVDLKNVERGLKLFRLDYDRYPKDEEGLAVLWDKSKLDPEADQAKWKKYLESPLPQDRWSHDWQYKQVTTHSSDETMYDLWSMGPDGQDGTDDDICSWKLGGAEGGTGAIEDAPPATKGSAPAKGG